MASTQDTEITLGTAKLLSLFFGLVIVCAVFFALGYTLGRKTDSGFPAVAGAAAPTGSSAAKPPSSANTSAAPMTFYKAVEQKSADSQLTPTGGDTTASNSPNNAAGKTDGESEAQAAKLPDPMAPIPGTGYFVQVAAVTKQEDADALVDALKKKQYPAFVAGNSAADKYFRVQLGPFGDIKEAESMRTRLINDGYNPILKK